MQYISRIRSAKSFSDVQTALFAAKHFNKLNDTVIYESIKRLAEVECKNYAVGYRLAKQIPAEKLSALNLSTLDAILIFASENKDYHLAHKAFICINTPRISSICKYVSLFDHANIEKMPTEIKDELGSLWIKVEQSGADDDCKLLTQLFTLLSFSIEKQQSLILQVISKPPSSSFTCAVVQDFLKHCSKTKNVGLAKKVWIWARPILTSSRGTLPFFNVTFEYYELQRIPVDALKLVWGEIVRAGLDSQENLVTSLCSKLAINLSEQKNFILSVLSKEPNSSFTCFLLTEFLKHCTETKDVDLANNIWNWGKSIIDNERSTADYFLMTFYYLRVLSPSLKHIYELWCQVTSFHLDRRPELVNSMRSALSFNRKEQRKFILDVISRQPYESFDCSVVEGFLKHCSDEKAFELAKKIWLWALEIRSKSKGTAALRNITAKYLTICGRCGDLSLLDEVMDEAIIFLVVGFAQVKEAYLNALAKNGALDRVLEFFDNIPLQDINELVLNPTIQALCHANRDTEALKLLIRFQFEIPKAVSVKTYTIVITSLSRRGKFEALLSLIEEGKSHGIEPNVVTWMSILCGCREHKNLPVALKAFEELKKVKYDAKDLGAAYFNLADVYQSCGDEVTANQIRNESIRKGLSKPKRVS